MKKLLAILLALMMVLVSVAALADDGQPATNPVTEPTTADDEGGNDTGNAASAPITNGQSATTAQVITIKKQYSFDVTDNATIPADEITFTVGKGTVTDATTVTTAPAVTIDKITIAEAAITAETKDYDLKINLPAYTEVGVYEYAVTENAGTVVGVTYTPNEYVLKVTVVRDKNENLILGGIALREKGEGKPKTDTIENSYAGGDLTVSKTVTGNMGDRSKEWTFKVTFTTEKDMTVGNTIKYTPVGATTATAIAAGWTGSTEVNITLKHGQSVKFENLPVGIKYTVVETNKDSSYDIDGEVETATALTAEEQSAEVEVVNSKTITIDTGVTLDSTVYMLIMALALAGFVVLKIRRREDY